MKRRSRKWASRDALKVIRLNSGGPGWLGGKYKTKRFRWMNWGRMVLKYGTMMDYIR